MNRISNAAATVFPRGRAQKLDFSEQAQRIHRAAYEAADEASQNHGDRQNAYFEQVQKEFRALKLEKFRERKLIGLVGQKLKKSEQDDVMAADKTDPNAARNVLHIHTDFLSRCNKALDQIGPPAEPTEPGGSEITPDATVPSAADAFVASPPENAAPSDASAPAHEAAAASPQGAHRTPAAPRNAPRQTFEVASARPDKPKSYGLPAWMRMPKWKKSAPAPQAADMLNLGDNLRDATKTPSQKTAAFGILAVAAGGAFVLPFAIWTSLDLCRKNSPDHDATGCTWSIIAAVGNGLLVAGGAMAAVALGCPQERKSERKHRRAAARLRRGEV